MCSPEPGAVTLIGKLALHTQWFKREWTEHLRGLGQLVSLKVSVLTGVRSEHICTLLPIISMRMGHWSRKNNLTNYGVLYHTFLLEITQYEFIIICLHHITEQQYHYIANISNNPAQIIEIFKTGWDLNLISTLNTIYIE